MGIIITLILLLRTWLNNLLKMLTILKQGDGYMRVYFTIFSNFIYA